jgi:hypothetical protein
MCRLPFYLNQSLTMMSVTVITVRPIVVSISFSRQYCQKFASVIGCLTVPTGHQDELNNRESAYEQRSPVVPDVLKPNVCHWMSSEGHLRLS